MFKIVPVARLRTLLDFRVVLAVGTTVFFWASAFAGIRIGLEDYSPEHVALLRYLTASGVLLLYALLVRMPLPALRDLPVLLLIGFLSITVYNVALNAGEKEVTAGVASMIIASAPIWVALLAGLFLGERLRPVGWWGIVLCFGGVTVIAVSTDDGLQVAPGALLVLLASVVHGASATIQKPVLRRYHAFHLTAYMIWGGTLVLLVFLPGLWEAMQAAERDSTLAVVYMGVFPGALAYATWAYALSKLPASIAASFLYLIPAVAILIAWAVLAEVPPPLSFVGGGLVLAGVVIVNTRGRIRQPVIAKPQ